MGAAPPGAGGELRHRTGETYSQGAAGLPLMVGWVGVLAHSAHSAGSFLHLVADQSPYSTTGLHGTYVAAYVRCA